MNANSLTTSEWLKDATQKLDAAGIMTAELDALVLLQDCLEIDKANILAHPEIVLLKKQRTFLDGQVVRRAKHEPLACIRGRVEFYGREFLVNKHVLVPRPETETMIEFGLQICKRNKLKTMADIGTGSGAVAVTMQLENPYLKVFASDVDKKCLEIACQNNNVYKTTLMFCHGDLFEPLVDKKVDLVLANLPYVPDDFEINEAARHEPPFAIFGGNDGLDLYRRLFEQIDGSAHKPGYVLTESLPSQHTELAQIARSYGYKLTKTRDFIQQFSLNRWEHQWHFDCTQKQTGAANSQYLGLWCGGQSGINCDSFAAAHHR